MQMPTVDKIEEYILDKNIPWWYLEAVFDNVNPDLIKKLQDKNNDESSAKFMCKIFPEIATKLKKRFCKRKFPSYEGQLKNALRTNLRWNLQNNNIEVNTLTSSMMEFILGYSLPDLEKHLQSLFDDKMRWDNYGTYWQIDHIYPCAKLKYSKCTDSNFRKLWALQNLRPLEKIENIKKSDTVIDICKEAQDVY